uniref:NADH dehydrogenase subunit 2 n=1 Tax=Ourococcus multisporus TaxID=132186 RepID=A0A076VFP0_9CHLO|nr:NADH dehydrogenase subunit 2 [Ourococcus multisporus]AIK29187.1 NADH dehydrogenase subunit 2 [Ourococcus multisporus]
MTLDVISWMPEGFFLVTLLALLCYGITPGATPFEEQLGVPLHWVKLEISRLEPKTKGLTLFLSNPSQAEISFFFKEDNVITTEMLSKKSKLFVENIALNEKEKTFGEEKKASFLNYNAPGNSYLGDTIPASGPGHASALLGAWAIPWCLLGFLLVFYCPLHTLMAGGVFLRDLFSVQLGSLQWIFAAAVLTMTLSWQKSAGIVHPEYISLTLLALLGQHLLMCSTDLMAMYVCLELQSFAVVVLCSLNYNNAYSIEAGIKYFLLSAFSSCLLLLGIGLIYWDTGLTQCHHLVELLNTTYIEPSISLWLGVWLVSLGLLWKLSAAPLHLWVADVYMGAWSSVTLFLSTLPKIAVLGFWIHTWHPLWHATFGNSITVFSALSLMVGALAPLAQTQLKRLLALSSVGHMGFLLMPLSAGQEAFAALWTYLILYLITNLAMWGLLMWPFGRPGKNFAGPQYIWDLSALNQTSPAAATAWAGVMLSLAGLPPVAGFLGKLGLFWWALNSHLYILVGAALVATLLSTIYYLRVLKVAYVDMPGNWGSYGKIPSFNAYLIAISWSLLVLLLWHGAPLILSSHLLLLAS